MTLKKAGDDDFDEKVIEASKEKPVLVDFWAEWCMPCKQFSPVIEDVGEEMEGEIDVAEVNVDKAERKAKEFGVRSIPNVKLFVDGEVKDEFVGARTESGLKRWIEERI
ncbi:MAG: thioredoxin [Candidatus Aenigmatarchaeota archaeon]